MSTCNQVYFILVILYTTDKNIQLHQHPTMANEAIKFDCVWHRIVISERLFLVETNMKQELVIFEALFVRWNEG
jgi:hypothetical protein